MRTTLNSVIAADRLIISRPGFERLHTFRSKVVSMKAFGERVIVVLANGKAYYSNAKLSRWYKIKLNDPLSKSV